VLAAKSVLTATQNAEKRAVTHRDFAQAGVHSGLRPPIDLTRAQADVAMLDVRLVRARSGVDVARAALAAALGYNALEVDAIPLGPDESPSPGLEDILRTTAHKNPFIAAALARLDAQRATTREITREMLPDLFGTLGLSGRAGGEATSDKLIPYGQGWLPDVANWHVGLVLAWNLFDGTVLARRRASVVREQVQRADLDLARLSATLGAERAYLDLDAAIKAIPGLNESVAAARANLAQADGRFKAGLGNVVEIADAEALVTNAELDLAVGEYTLSRARAALGRVMGEMLASNQPSSGKRP
jgi:outer membrane protein TolC